MTPSAPTPLKFEDILTTRCPDSTRSAPPPAQVWGSDPTVRLLSA